MNLAALHDGEAPADHCHIAFVEITEGRGAPFRQASRNQFPAYRPPCIATWATPGSGFRPAEATPCRRPQKSPDAPHGQIGCTLTPGAIGFHTQPFFRRGRRDSGGPDHCLARDPRRPRSHPRRQFYQRRTGALNPNSSSVFRPPKSSAMCPARDSPCPGERCELRGRSV